ncbi:hypothetical protein ESA94_16030 [Lacibacter luteus]|uniref:Uncharacterized protein n=1 Tax=Lacibacter luteus TaxID=2508719 RepID=A0A4Q1CGJ8_9BACT|nr:hypothetical protein [Lacibacter luteus]RXK58895.1 hypothetical protein ESA94_16030 [Lacibacter luteus]
MRITKVKTRRYTATDIEKLDISLELFSEAVNSVEFKQRVEDHPKFDTVEQYSSKEVYSIIMNGDEADTNGGIDHEADLDLTLDLQTSSDAIGYTQQNRIFTFLNFFRQLEPTKLAGHFAHEYCHTLGFADPSDLSDTARNVPYEVGRIIEEISINNQRTFITDDTGLTDTEKTARRVRRTARNSRIVSADAEETTTRVPVIKTKRKKAAARKPAVKKKAVAKKKPAPKKTTRKSGGAVKKKTAKRKVSHS